MARRTSDMEKRAGKATKNRQTPKPGKRGGKADCTKTSAPLDCETKKKGSPTSKPATGKTVQKKATSQKKVTRTTSKSAATAKASRSSDAPKAMSSSDAVKTHARSDSRKAVAKKTGSNGKAGKAAKALAQTAPVKPRTAPTDAKPSKPVSLPPATHSKGGNGRPAGVLQAARSVASRATRAPESPRVRRTQLTPAELAEFREILLAKRHELVTDMANLEDEARRGRSENSPASSAMPIHMADIGSDTWEQEFTLNLMEKERTIVREIDEALERIENKTFGICLATGKSITKARLRAKPWAKYCIEYARKRELGLA